MSGTRVVLVALTVLFICDAVQSTRSNTVPEAFSTTAAGQKKRTVMTYLVGHSSDFGGLVEKTVATAGAITSAAPICSNPGRLPAGGANLTSLYCLEKFLKPLRAKAPHVELLPMVQMANEVLLDNLKHYGATVATYKKAAIQWSPWIDGYLFYPQLASKVGHEGDYKALVLLLNLWAKEMHALNKTLGVFVPNYHSKFSPAAILDDTEIDFWMTNLEVGSCADVSDFYWSLHGKRYKKGGGALFTSDGKFNSAGCMESLFSRPNGTLPKSNASTLGFYSDFSSMGDVWWPGLREWVGAGATLSGSISTTPMGSTDPAAAGRDASASTAAEAREV